MHNWLKLFRETTKFFQSLPKNYLENICKYIYNPAKDTIEKETYLNPSIVGNVDETPIVLEPIT